MSQEVISEQTQSNLEILRKAGVLKGFYLAGGTGLALQLRHRISLDLDFFSKKKINPKTLIQKISTLGRFSVEKEEKDTLIGIFNKTNVSFFTYNYPLLFPLIKIKKISVADIRDIGCMKISAISSRGSKKDFVDVFFICQSVSLKTLLALFEKKYKGVNYNMVHILKSLVYFDDARKDPMPQMIKKISWPDIEEFFIKEVKAIKL